MYSYVCIFFIFHYTWSSKSFTIENCFGVFFCWWPSADFNMLVVLSSNQREKIEYCFNEWRHFIYIYDSCIPCTLLFCCKIEIYYKESFQYHIIFWYSPMSTENMVDCFMFAWSQVWCESCTNVHNPPTRWISSFEE